MTRIEQNTQSAREFLEKVWSQGDRTVAERIIDPDFRFLLAFSHLDGRDTFLALVEKNRDTFENLTYSVAPDDIVAEELKAVAYWTMTFRHVKPWRNIPASNKQVSVDGMTFFRFNEAGNITEARVQNDVLSLMEQINGIQKLYDF